MVRGVKNTNYIFKMERFQKNALFMKVTKSLSLVETSDLRGYLFLRVEEKGGLCDTHYTRNLLTQTSAIYFYYFFEAF